MDLTLVDITEFPPLPLGEEVILIGRKGSCSITALDVAEMAGTIPHDILSRIGKRVPRRYLR